MQLEEGFGGVFQALLYYSQGNTTFCESFGGKNSIVVYGALTDSTFNVSYYKNSPTSYSVFSSLGPSERISNCKSADPSFSTGSPVGKGASYPLCT
jgi:hypothetical protein